MPFLILPSSLSFVISTSGSLLLMSSVFISSIFLICQYSRAKKSQSDFALEYWQIKKMEDMKTDDHKIDWGRDYFLFLFYTAMRLTEPRSISEEKGESDFVRMFEYKVNKQKKETWVKFELPPEALRIWDKYEGNIDLYGRS